MVTPRGRTRALVDKQRASQCSLEINELSVYEFRQIGNSPSCFIVEKCRVIKHRMIPAILQVPQDPPTGAR